ncbi:RNA exonuclease, putative [Penicillium digitatum]|nr:RNA exonuclease, putative [Penicillium digitatum]
MESKMSRSGEPNIQHVKETKFPCPVCKGRKFRSEQGFGDHLKNVHNIFTCLRCDAIYASRDDLARHRSETKHKLIRDKLGDNGAPVFRSVSSPAATNTSSTQVPELLCLPPSPARRSTSQTHQPAAETCRLASQKYLSNKEAPQSPTHPQELERDRPARGHVQNRFHQPQNQDFEPQAEVPQVPVGFSRAASQIHQVPSQISQTPPRVYHTPSQINQAPTRRIKTQVPVNQSPVQTSQLPLKSSKLQQVQGSRQVEGSQSLQLSQSGVKDLHSPAQDTPSPVQISEEMDRISQSSMQLSAPGGTTSSTPATNTTTPSLFIPPTTSIPTFSLVYHNTKHRWADLEPLEQTLILKYLLGRCHTQQRLHCQGYNTPKTIDTTPCLKRGEPHQAHTCTRSPTHRKAIVMGCKIIETTLCTSELAFITAIDFLTGEVLINSYVAPTAPVTNWLTPVSGITPEKMDAAVTNGKAFRSNVDARHALQTFLNCDTVLIGHALHHDLRTLDLIHGRIVDTSVVTAEAVFSNFAAKTVLPRVWELKALAQELIGIEIQTSAEGHHSLEDVLATREILIWCLRGPGCLKAWAEKSRSSYEILKQQRGEQKKNVRKKGKKAGRHSSGRGNGKKKPVAK